MLAFHPTKRAREDDSDSEDDRYLKKSRPFAFHGFHNAHTNPRPASNLAFRPSLTPSPPRLVSHLEAMTPAQSEHGEANSPVSVHDDVLNFSSPHFSDDEDMDMEDDDDIIGSQPPESPFVTTFMRPAKLNFEPYGREPEVNNTGRMPTPMFPTFGGPRNAMNTSGMGGLTYPSSGFAGGMSMTTGSGYLGLPSNPILSQPPPSRKLAQIDEDRSRRMPSPISEDEDLPDTPTALTQSQLSRLSVTSNHHQVEQMDMESGGHDGDDSELAPPPGVVTTPTRGRKRSGALSGKSRFSMGYRDDCEKCRQRVPGHYAHFLPS